MLSGLKAEQRAVAALQVPAATIETATTVHKTQINHAIRRAISSEEAIKTVAESLQQDGAEFISVMDVEPFFKTSPAPPKPEVVAALRKELLPFINLLSATVPEVMELLKDAGIPANYPRGIPDVQAMAQALARNLGPQYVLIKREFVDEEGGATTLHYVLAGCSAEPAVMVTSQARFQNPKRIKASAEYTL
ncbi:hypothetical protein N0V82_010859 [Gnomoniopsis sp. IMI 355080]|nr:hypothetical protein N0V82_010859 [Gnomoniopsis sp. IMI 355080]